MKLCRHDLTMRVMSDGSAVYSCVMIDRYDRVAMNIVRQLRYRYKVAEMPKESML